MDLEQRILRRLLTEGDPESYHGYDGLLDWTDEDRRDQAYVLAADAAHIATLEAEAEMDEMTDRYWDEPR